MSAEDPSHREARASRLAASGVVGASVAHELRNALAVAESALYLAQRDIDDRARLVRHLDQVGVEIRKAHAVIGSVLGLARGEPVSREATPIASLVDAARNALPGCPHVTFAVTIPEDLTAFCDPILFERVLSNLLLNAIEAFEGRPGRVSVRAWREEGRVQLEVEDDGPGIAPEVAARLFEPLVTGKAKGTGLGLSLSRTIVEAHGGGISAGAGAQGGAMFRMWLPEP
ncbi:sensor histidine kinase [Polyangium aurulentum]|uniref:sensor histidine kinase n=1 Tax=Polyangium aurulentum TaxID=2567896 RepID=UPI0010AE0642|nr:HAMP domain-containing sensor histidine kinase [Polyangium aurulentum]UQA61815.1 HAMP domain-containing histidine kinase [Polyangium aurulentum]